ncbi:nucleotidyltransferase-like protein [Bacillus sp. FJAT-45037]|uniref:nucleotidyltransferase-like protein n=1 Tax=Bacillus sp. FJAT-45037 TaxID=2011007 RepID=UPI000C23ABF3|nr:nucleotidyltransferase-like protein [Bacillus sp. FJAT-45037]
MDMLLRQLYQDRASEEDTFAILTIEKETSPLSILDGFDSVVLVIKNDPKVDWHVKHYQVGEEKVALHSLSQTTMHYSLIAGTHRRLVDWLFHGKIVFDRNEFLQGVKERIDTFPPGDRMKKMTIQFSKMLRRFDEGKTLFHHHHTFDAFSNMMHALHHLARLAVIRHGFYPEVTVWEQVKRIEPETYKLYQELLKSEESLEKRIQLFILATELAVRSKTKVGSEHFLSLLHGKEEGWTIAEMMEIPEVQEYRIDLELLVNFLIEKEYLVVDQRETKAKGIQHLRYQLKNSN